MIESDVRDEELEHFEAALHDARHLNQTITDTAERLLAGRGYSSDASPWDMRPFREDEELKRFLMIYSASRDLSAAMLMHEISRDPTQATRDITGIPMHRLFYRQFRISDDRLRAARMTWKLGETDKTLRLSSAFRVVPKILIDNAIKYGARDSEISINFVERTTDSFYRIVFTNYGLVIRDDEREKVFSRGVRGSNKGGAQGHGFGLWLAKIIVQANGGAIELRIHEKGRDMSGGRVGNTIVEIKLVK
jgi:light-regulated signal transduction histidine kinase (bacteriophytochrome)